MKWFPNWSRDIVVVIASGPSAKGQDIASLSNVARAIAVNRSIELAPWADVWYSGDTQFWATYATRPFDGLRVTVEGRMPAGVPHHTIRIADKRTQAAERAWMLMEPRGTIGTGGNSGFQGINLAAQFGARRIILVGFDMHLNDGSHWHGDHIAGLRNPEAELMEKWRRVLDAQANTLSEYGIDVVNVSPGSALRNFRKTTIEGAIDRWNRQSIIERSTLAAE